MKAAVSRTVVTGLLATAIFASPLIAPAVDYTLTDNNSRAVVDPGSAMGMKEWSILMPNGEWQNQLNQQWFWYRIGDAPETSIDTIGLTGVLQPNNRTLVSTYANNTVSVRIDYLLSGGTVASGISDIGETITINNLSSAPLSFHFFQYSDFNLQGVNGGQSIQLGKNLRGLYNEAFQFQDPQIPGAPTLTETVTTPGAQHGEGAYAYATLAKLTDAFPTVLSDTVSKVGPGDVTWALQWDFTINPGSSVMISKDKYIQVPAVPEPATAALLSLGLLGWIIRRRCAA